MTKASFISLLLSALLAVAGVKTAAAAGPATYYIDSRQGNDQHSGTDSRHPWKTIARLEQAVLHPGDSIRFKRGSAFTGPLHIAYSGREAEYITLTDYGYAKDPAPAFTNPVFRAGNYGNCIRISGSYVIVERLFFSGGAAYTDIPYGGDGWVVWEMGAIHIDSAAARCIVRNNEIKDCVAGIRSNGPYALITHNYLHDCNRVLKQWNWGPIGIWLGADHQEVCYNRVFNYSAVDPRIGWGPDSYGSGADGGAMEIDDARYDKSDISIHHNYTRDCQGFLEVTWTDVKKNPVYKGFHIHHNISDDYQQFVALWCGAGCLIDHNTIVRRKVNANDWGVFNITQRNSRNIVRDNIVVTEKNIVVFNTGRKGTAKPNTIISHNLYYAAADSLLWGREGPGDSAVIADPQFVQYRRAQRSEDFSLRATSPALRGGAAIGAVEYRQGITLAGNGKALLGIRLAAGASATEQFAAAELSAYLAKMSGAVFHVHTAASTAGAAIVLTVNPQLPTEDYSISIQDNGILLSAGSGRAVVYAVYDLLHRLGCVWLAPAFSYYNGHAEHVPRSSTLRYEAAGTVYEHPNMAYRKLDIEEGRTHTIENLRQIIAWMPKVRLNVLMAPLNYQGAGRVQWDNWRAALTPELEKRGMLIEVGGHGYQNFINAGMEGGSLFRQHPDWFGKNKNGVPDTTENIVFNTSHPGAVAYFIKNIITYLRAHPEIAIFDCWPPDVAKWAECPETAALGPAADRQAVLMNQVDSALHAEGLPVKLEVIAYGQVLLPPQKALHKNILVDICPINQNFEKQLYDSAVTNTAYANAIRDWRQRFDGDMGLYSYYRKYAWRSLPVVIPRYIQQDLQWCAGLPLQGVSTYAEPGDWYTYELNHYALAGLAWNAAAPVDSLVNEYARTRYGSAVETALAAYRYLEQVLPRCSSIPYTTLKSPAVLEAAAISLQHHVQAVAKAAGRTADTVVASNLHRLGLMLQYAEQDLAILRLRASGIAGRELETKVARLVNFLQQHAAEGVFVLYRKNNDDIFLKHYNSIR